MTAHSKRPLAIALTAVALAIPSCEGDDDDDGGVRDSGSTLPPQCSSEETGVGSSSSSEGGAESSSSSTSSASSSSSSSGSSSTTTGATPLASCLDILNADPAAVSGVHSLSDADGGIYDVFCDMDTDGGGWTLVMKAASDLPTFGADATYWEDEVLFNELDVMPNDQPTGADAKYRSFVDVAGQELRLEFIEPDRDFVHDALGGATALELFSGPELLIAGSEVDACHGDLLSAAPNYVATEMTFGNAHQFYGINGTDVGPSTSGSMRFGFGSNDESFGPWGPRMGIGSAGSAGQGNSIRWRSQVDCNAADCGCYGTELSVAVTSGNLWVR